MDYILTKPFITNARLLGDNRPNLKSKIADCVSDFVEHVFQSKYYRKKLKGYEAIHELEVGGDIRVFVEVLIRDNLIKFLNIGTHSSLNLTGSGKIRLS